LPVRPLKQRLVNADHDVRAWLDQRVRNAGTADG
jgi:hypothetical protein